MLNLLVNISVNIFSVHQLGIEATTKGQFSGDIAVDNIMMSPGSCERE